MPPLPVLSPAKVVKALERLDWRVVRQKGSHIVMTKPGDIATFSTPHYQGVALGARFAV